MKRLTGKYENGTAYYNIVPGDSTIDRLAAIEDILGDAYDLDRLRELAEADREGRCVVLPAPLGNTVYRIEYVEQCQGRYEIGICKHRFDILFYAMECRNFGKTVFLTREEAEAALAKLNSGT